MNRLRLVPLFLVGVVLIGGTVWYLSPVGEQYRLARLSDAELVTLTSRQPKETGAWLELAKRMERQGMNGEALVDYRHATESSPRNPVAWTGLTQMALALHDPQTAHDAAQQLLTLAPSDGERFRIAGDALRQVGDREGAMIALRKAVSLRPNDPIAWNTLARVLLSVHVLDEALQAAQSAVRLAPQNADYLVTLAQAQRQLSRPQEALATIRQARQYSPENAQVLLEAGTIGTVTAQTPDEKQETITTLVSARERLKGTPQEADTLRLLGQFYLREKQPEKARETLEACLQIAPGDSTAQFTLSRVLAVQGHAIEARTLTEQYTKQAEYELLARQLQMRLQREPTRTDLWNRLGKLHATNHQPEQARRAFEKSLRINPHQPDIQRQAEPSDQSSVYNLAPSRQ